MNKFESKYAHTAEKMDQALVILLGRKDFEYITVQDICKEAGVSRSTFYLHYESVMDLLEESIEKMNRDFMNYFPKRAEHVIRNINTAGLDELDLVTYENVIPYLTYIKENQHVYRACVNSPQVLRTFTSTSGLFRFVIDPILERFHTPET